ncbi:MAG TPA: hypothetical protein VGF13_13165 [Verrucomicrobiae bacterium]
MKKEIRFYREGKIGKADKLDRADENRDPITGARGAHPVGTGLGAVAGGAATGAAVGTVAGPVGTAVGMVAGAVVGGLAGKGIAERVNPTVEREYWSKAYLNEPYYKPGRPFGDYEGAYQTGYEGYSRYGDERSWDEVKADLQRDYETNRGTSELTWEEASHATRAAWERLGRQPRESSPQRQTIGQDKDCGCE